jgi:Tol biopolymer transport system component
MENCSEPFASPDGHYLAIPQATPNGMVRPFILDLESGRLWPVFDPGSWIEGTFHDWHPDSRHILFSSDYTLDAGLWLADIETGEYSVLAGLGWAVNGGAAVSPDGTRVVYTDGGETWLVILDGSQREQLDLQGGYVRGWSPDGNWILSGGGGVVGKTDVSDERHIAFSTDFADLAQGPLPGNVIVGTMLTALSPDGRTVAATHVLVPKGADADFNAFEAGNVYLIDVLEGDIRPLLPEGHCLSADWSPDGSMLAFLSDRSGTVEVWLANADGSGLRQLTHEGPVRQFVKYYAPIWLSARR